jgi:GAF domain-containing protein
VHETRQRNAELALINSVQEALAGELEMQAIYDVVGDKIQEIFDAQVVDIGVFDEASGFIHFPYAIERGVWYPDEPSPISTSSTTQRLLETKAPVLINDLPAWDRERGEVSGVIQGEPALSVLAAPLFSGEDVRGRISLQNSQDRRVLRGTRLLTTLTGSLSVARERAPRPRDPPAERRARADQQRQQAIAGESRLQVDTTPSATNFLRSRRPVSASRLTTKRPPQLPVRDRRGERLQQEPIPLIGFLTRMATASR